MRERRDKATPNAWHVYEKVLQSIKDNITPAHLVEIIKEATDGNEQYPKMPDDAKVAAEAAEASVKSDVRNADNVAAKQPST